MQPQTAKTRAFDLLPKNQVSPCLSMKKLLFALVFLCISASIPSCSTDFDIAESWKEIPVVYGMLDPTQAVQYLRVSKAFLDENTSAYQMAQSADSLYLEEPTSVQLKAQSNGNVVQTIDLQKVDAANEGIVKDDGIFATSPYYLYKTTETILNTRSYQLVVTTANGKTVTAETPIVENLEISKPAAGGSPLNIVSNSAVIPIRWNRADNAAIFDLDISVKYKDIIAGTNEEIIRTVKLDVFTGISLVNLQENTGDFSTSSTTITYNYKVADLLSLMAIKIPAPDATIAYRYFVALDFEVFAATQAVLLSTDSNNSQFSITASQNTFTYNNITGGYGLFASRTAAKVEQIYITPASFRSIACSDVTRFLKFAVHTSEASFPNC